MAVALPLHGGCDCGAVRYAVAGAPLLVYACHCHDCQTRSGSAFSLTVVVRTADLSIAGPLEVTRTTTRRGREVDKGRCSRCHVQLMASAPAAPDYASLLAGTLDDAGWAVPIAQIWVESALPWALIPGARSLDADALDFYALGEEWRATAPAFRPGASPTGATA